MARVTVEDCVIRVPNRFELVLLASQRTRELFSGAESTLERENDRNPIIALREIAEEAIDLEDLRDTLVSGLQRHVEMDEPEDDSMAILAAAEKEWAGVAGELQREAEGMGQTTTAPEVTARPDDAANPASGAAPLSTGEADTSEADTGEAVVEAPTAGDEAGTT